MASGEDSLIARYFRPVATDPGAFGLTDDAAVLKASGDDLVVTTDAIVESVHFLPDDPPDTIARKALRVNLSDLAAKGATPKGFVMTLALREAGDAWLQPFARGLGEDARLFGCALLGGDTVSTPGPVMISITAFGLTPPGKMVRRHGARAGRVLARVGHQLAHQQLGVLRHSRIEERCEPGHGVTRHARRHWRRRKAQEEEDVHRRAFTRFGSADMGKADKAAGWYPSAAKAKHRSEAPGRCSWPD